MKFITGVKSVSRLLSTLYVKDCAATLPQIIEMFLQKSVLRYALLTFFFILLVYVTLYWKSSAITTEIIVARSYLTQRNTTAHDENPCGRLERFQYDDRRLVACLKKQFLNPPSLLPYNLANPGVENPTQHGQNLVALKLLSHKTNGFFIECGAMDGEIYSNTLFLERQYGWTGLLIEAEPNNYRNLILKNRKSWTSPACLSPKTTAEKLTMVGLDYISPGRAGLTLMNDSKPLREFPGYVNAKSPSAEVQCFPLYTYLLALDRTEVDYFSLDLEGADFEILKTIPFDKVIFKVLEVEVRWVDEGKEAVRKFLEEKGYIFVQEIVVDYIFVHNSLGIPRD